MRSVVFAVPGGLGPATGGAIYDRRVVAGLRKAGWKVAVLDWPDSFPLPDAGARRIAAESLAAITGGSLAVIDGLALGTLPDLARQHAVRLRLIGLVHHPLALEAGLEPATAARLAAEEREALRWVRAVVATSRTTAATLTRDYAVPPERVAVVPPGLQPIASVPAAARDSSAIHCKPPPTVAGFVSLS